MQEARAGAKSRNARKFSRSMIVQALAIEIERLADHEMSDRVRGSGRRGWQASPGRIVFRSSVEKQRVVPSRRRGQGVRTAAFAKDIRAVEQRCIQRGHIIFL